MICTVLYVAVSLVLTGIAHYSTLNNAAPVSNALKALGFSNIRTWVGAGALFGMISALLTTQYGQARHSQMRHGQMRYGQTHGHGLPDRW